MYGTHESSDALVIVERLRVTLGGRRALDGVDLTILPHGHMAVLGANGAGKSTLLRALRGRVYPDMREGGRVLWRDEAPAHSSPSAPAADLATPTDRTGQDDRGRRQRPESLLPQDAIPTAPRPEPARVAPAPGNREGSASSDAPSPRDTRLDDAPLTGRALTALVAAAQQERYIRQGWDITGEELIVSGAFDTPLLYEDPTPTMRARASALAASLGAEELLSSPVPSLSQGQLRLLLVARALFRSPRLLLLDEVCDGLDSMARERVLDALTRAAATGVTLVVAAHRPEDLPGCVTQGIRLHDGRVTARGPVATLIPPLEPAPLAPEAAQAPPVAHPAPQPDDGLREGRSPVADATCGPATALDAADKDTPAPDAPLTAGMEPTPAVTDAAGMPLAPASTDDGEVLLRVTRATVYVDRTPVLHDVNWTIRHGEQWAVIGPNGAGKSTLLRLLAGEEFAAAGGDVHLMPGGCGEAVRGLTALRRHVAIVSDRLQAAYAYDVTAEECVLSGLHGTIGVYEQPSPEECEQVAYWLDALNVSQLSGRRIRTLSTGQLRRVLLARALVGDPLLLLLDEPCSGLDEATRDSFLHMLGDLTRRGVHLVLVTHHENDIIPETTHVLRLEAGQVVQAGRVALPGHVALTGRVAQAGRDDGAGAERERHTGEATPASSRKTPPTGAA